MCTLKYSDIARPTMQLCKKGADFGLSIMGKLKLLSTIVSFWG